MQLRYSLVRGLLVFGLVLGAARVSLGRAEGGTLPVLRPSPTWELKDVAGKAVRSDEFKGKVIVVDFWATWCGPCLEEMPGYIQLQEKYRDQGLVILGFSMDKGRPAAVKKFTDRLGINYPVLMANDAAAGLFGGAEALPTTYLIDRAGQIRHRKVGTMSTADYEQLLLALLKG